MMLCELCAPLGTTQAVAAGRCIKQQAQQALGRAVCASQGHIAAGCCSLCLGCSSHTHGCCVSPHFPCLLAPHPATHPTTDTTIYNMCTQKPPHDHSEQLYAR
jgi:hypothetical protein